jgi:hypothetical protein
MTSGMRERGGGEMLSRLAVLVGRVKLKFRDCKAFPRDDQLARSLDRAWESLWGAARAVVMRRENHAVTLILDYIFESEGGRDWKNGCWK